MSTKAYVPPPSEEELQRACQEISRKVVGFSPKDMREALRIALHARFFITAKVRAEAIKKFLQGEKR